MWFCRNHSFLGVGSFPDIDPAANGLVNATHLRGFRGPDTFLRFQHDKFDRSCGVRE